MVPSNLLDMANFFPIISSVRSVYSAPKNAGRAAWSLKRIAAALGNLNSFRTSKHSRSHYDWIKSLEGHKEKQLPRLRLGGQIPVLIEFDNFDQTTRSARWVI